MANGKWQMANAAKPGLITTSFEIQGLQRGKAATEPQRVLASEWGQTNEHPEIELGEKV